MFANRKDRVTTILHYTGIYSLPGKLDFTYFCVNYYTSYLYSSYSFPKDTILRDKWIINLNFNYIFTPTIHTRICNKHFDDSDFNNTDQLRRLKPDVIPTKMMGVRYCQVIYIVTCRLSI